MKLRTALTTIEKIMKNTKATMEQLRMGSPDDRESYLIIVRLPDGTVYQVDDDRPWPPKEDE